MEYFNGHLIYCPVCIAKFLRLLYCVATSHFCNLGNSLRAEIHYLSSSSRRYQLACRRRFLSFLLLLYGSKAQRSKVYRQHTPRSTFFFLGRPFFLLTSLALSLSVSAVLFSYIIVSRPARSFRLMLWLIFFSAPFFSRLVCRRQHTRSVYC